MIPEYIQKIKDWPVPKTGKEVPMLLEFTEYYRTYITQYSGLKNQLNEIKKEEKFMWNKERCSQRAGYKHSRTLGLEICSS